MAARNAGDVGNIIEKILYLFLLSLCQTSQWQSYWAW